MKQRNLLLALALLALFVLAGVFYFRSYVVPKPFGIILFTGEGLVSNKLAAARLYDGGSDRRLTIESLPNLALVTTHAADFAVPDAASAAGALACGSKLNQRALGIDPSGKRLTSICELAHDRGRALGLITSGSLTDPVPAAFYAHLADARDREGVAAQLAERAAEGFFDLILGGGGGDFMPDTKGGRRRDGRDLALEMPNRGGYTSLRGNVELQTVQAWRGPRLLGFFASGALKFRDQLEAGDAQQPTLAEMVRQSVEVLQRKAGGYFLVVDAGLIGQASARNEGEHALQELLELDRAVGVALQYGGPKTLVVVAGGASTGGMALNGYPLRQDHGVALLGMNANGLPSITWATGPNCPAPAVVPPPGPAMDATGQPVPSSSPPSPAAPSSRMANPAGFYAPVAADVADDALVAGFGPGSEKLRGFLDNTFVFELLRGEL